MLVFAGFVIDNNLDQMTAKEAILRSWQRLSVSQRDLLCQVNFAETLQVVNFSNPEEVLEKGIAQK